MIIMKQKKTGDNEKQNARNRTTETISNQMGSLPCGLSQHGTHPSTVQTNSYKLKATPTKCYGAALGHEEPYLQTASCLLCKECQTPDIHVSTCVKGWLKKGQCGICRILMVVVGGARLFQHLSTELNLRLHGLFTTILLRLMADSPTCRFAHGRLSMHGSTPFVEFCRFFVLDAVLQTLKSWLRVYVDPGR